MTKMALLIGVSEYVSGLSPLPAAKQDIKELKRVLESPEIGEFDEVQSLINPSSQEMRMAIEALFSNCTKEDLVLLYFSGHGVTDENNRFYFASHDTNKTDQGLIKSTAVSAGTVHDFMEDSRSKRKVVILDCCYSGAFAKGMTAKNLMDVIDIQKQLGGEGRAVLTSSTSTQYSFEQKGSNLSVYTRYLIEGLETGSADYDEDGAISAEDLHSYAKQKVQEATLAMKPEIYVSREGFKILLARAPVMDPVIRFRREVERLAQMGQIPNIYGEVPDVIQTALDAKCRNLGLSPQDSENILAEVLKPYRDHKRNLRTYERHFRGAIINGQSIDEEQRLQLQYLQKSLELSNEDIEWMEEQAYQAISADANTDTLVQKKSNVEVDVPKAIGMRNLEIDAEESQSESIQVASIFEKIKRNTTILWLVSSTLIGGILIYIASNLGLSPQKMFGDKTSSGVSTTEAIESCIIMDFNVQLFDEPEGILTGETLTPNTQITLTGEKAQGRIGNNTWVYVKPDHRSKGGWTFERNTGPCSS